MMVSEEFRAKFLAHDKDDPPEGCIPHTCMECGGLGVIMRARLIIGPVRAGYGLLVGIPEGMGDTTYERGRCPGCRGRRWVWGPAPRPKSTPDPERTPDPE